MGNDAFTKMRELFARWNKDYIFKTLAGSVFSFGVTVLFALYNGYLGIRLLSLWNGSICVFYLLLAAIRGTILLTEKNNAKSSETEKVRRRQRTFALTSAMLFLLNLSLIVPITLMVMLEKPIKLGLTPAIAMAAYTTYKIIMASLHIKKNKHNDILIAELRTINFIDALVSVLTLQNALITVESTDADSNDMLVLSSVSSAAIYLFILFVTIRFIIKVNKKK